MPEKRGESRPLGYMQFVSRNDRACGTCLSQLLLAPC